MNIRNFLQKNPNIFELQNVETIFKKENPEIFRLISENFFKNENN